MGAGGATPPALLLMPWAQWMQGPMAQMPMQGPMQGPIAQMPMAPMPWAHTLVGLYWINQGREICMGTDSHGAHGNAMGTHAHGSHVAHGTARPAGPAAPPGGLKSFACICLGCTVYDGGLDLSISH